MRKKITVNEGQILELYNIGMSTTRIAVELNVDRSVIRRVLKDNGVQCRPNKVNSIQDVFALIKEDNSTGCWIWTGGKNNKGYGQISINGVASFTHRLLYTLKNGIIPDGLIICHKCDNPPCCNPDHLFEGTFKDNIVDCYKKGRNPSAKLHAEEIKIIKGLKQDGISIGEIANRLGHGVTTVTNLLRGKSYYWK